MYIKRYMLCNRRNDFKEKRNQSFLLMPIVVFIFLWDELVIDSED